MLAAIKPYNAYFSRLDLGLVQAMLLSGNLSQISIASARLTLRSCTAVDAAESFAEVNARIAEYMSWNPPTREEHEKIWQRIVGKMKRGEELPLVIRLASIGEFIGMAGLHSADAELLEIGLWIKQSAHGRGFGREAVAAVVEWASETFLASGFLYPVVDENTPSRRLAEALRGEIIGTRQRQKPGDKLRTLLLYRISAPLTKHSDVASPSVREADLE